MEDRTYVPAALEYLDPSGLDYRQWAEVGMALHAEGYPVGMWDEWSRRDPARYHPGECERKWASFGNSPAKVAGGTIVQMAREAGWRPARRPWDGPDGDEEIGWDAPIVCDPSWLEPAEMPERPWDPVGEAIRYLVAVFDAEDTVGYVTSAFQGDDGRWKPAGRGAYDRTAGQLIAELRRTGSVEDALGTSNPEAGAWVRFNPLDGAGVRNADVTEFRHALVESDELEPERQLALIRELGLPCSAIVESGGKSIHAIVRVDAADYAEYRRRVDYLYQVCSRHGLKVDTQNKNPSRLSRFPGFMRAGRPQRMLDGRCGKASWDEWVEWVEERTDDLPEFENLGGIWDDMPELAPELIHGILRRGHKMLVAAGSKTGKTFAMMELSVAIAEGLPWLGFQCERGRVLYINLELDRASCLHRFRDVYAALGARPAHVGGIDVWNLRGKSMPMDRLVPSLVRRALKTRPAAIILDPVYKVNMGDENSAEQVARFCNQLDMVAEQVGASIVYVHHHSKGAQGSKASIDRASGSGVFARDADAQLDMVVLPLADKARDQVEAREIREAVQSFMDSNIKGWDDEVDLDAILSGGNDLISQCRALTDNVGLSGSLLDAVYAARERARSVTALRAEFTLREFAAPAPVNLWFREPLHEVDSDGMLADIILDTPVAVIIAFGGGYSSAKNRSEQKKAIEEKKDRERKAIVQAIGLAVRYCIQEGDQPTRKNVAKVIGRVEQGAEGKALSLKDGAGTVNGASVPETRLKNWTTAKSSDWCPWHMKLVDGAWVLTDQPEKEGVSTPE